MDGQLEAILLNHFNYYTGELEIPIEQIKNVLEEVGLKYDLSPKEWFKILLSSKIINKFEPPFDALPVFVNSLNVLPQLSYGELKILNYYYPKTLNINQEVLESKRQSDLTELGKWLASYGKNYSIVELSNLKSLDLSKTQLQSLPESIGALSNLQTLDLSETPLQSLPESIGALFKLIWLDLSETQLKTLSDSIGTLSNLELLFLNRTPLELLPDSIGALTNLHELWLNLTQLKSLPDSIGTLSNLECLYLRGTPLELLPNSIGTLSKLNELNLGETKLESLPDSIGALSNLKWLNLHGTSLRSYIITEKRLLQKMGYRDVLEMYLAHKKDHNKYPYECSVCENPENRLGDLYHLYQCICCNLPVCYHNQTPCDGCMGSICENCFIEFLRECNTCLRLLCIGCLYDHECTVTPN